MSGPFKHMDRAAVLSAIASKSANSVSTFPRFDVDQSDVRVDAGRRDETRAAGADPTDRPRNAHRDRRRDARFGFFVRDNE